MTESHSIIAGTPIVRIAASSAISSASGVLWLVADCFLQNQSSGTKEFGPIKHNMDPDVLCESTRLPAKSASTNNTRLRSSAGSLRYARCAKV